MNSETTKDNPDVVKPGAVFSGVAMFAVAAFFAISILVKVLDFGIGAADGNFLYKLGSLLVNSYGFSCLLVPVFFITAGVFCIDSRWSLAKAMSLLLSFIPFFTVVAAEKLIRMALANDASLFAIAKVVMYALSAIGLVVAEYLLTYALCFNAGQKTKSETDDLWKDSDENAEKSWKKSEAKSEKGKAKKESAESGVQKKNKREDKTQEEDKPVSELTTDEENFFEPEISENFFEEEIIEEDPYAEKEKTSAQKMFGSLDKAVRVGKNRIHRAFSYADNVDVPEKYEGEKEAVDINDFYTDHLIYADEKENETATENSGEQSAESSENFGAVDESSNSDENSNSSNSIDDTQAPLEISVPEEKNYDVVSQDREGEYKVRNPWYEDVSDLKDRAYDFANQVIEEDEPEESEENVQEKELPVDSYAEEFKPSAPTIEKFEEPAKVHDSCPAVREPVAEISKPSAKKYDGDKPSIKSALDGVFAKMDEDARSDVLSAAEDEDAELDAAIEDFAAFDRELEEESDGFEEAETSEEQADAAKKNIADDFVPELEEDVEELAGPDDDSENVEEIQELEAADDEFENEFNPLDEERLREQERIQDELIRAEIARLNQNNESEINVDLYDGAEKEEESFDIVEQLLAEQKKSEKEEEELLRRLEEKERVKEESIVNENGNIGLEEIADAGEDLEILEEVSDDVFDLEELEEMDEESAEDDGTDEPDIFGVIGETQSFENNFDADENLQDEDSDDALDVEEELDEDESFADEVNDEEIAKPVAVITDENGVTKPVEIVPKKTHGPYNISTNLLTAYEDNPYWIIDKDTEEAAQNLKETLAEFKIDAEVTGIIKGPVVTMFEVLPAPGVRLNKIVALQDNIALRLAATSVRIVAPIPGKHAVGIEIPNKERAIISIRECLEQERPEWKKMGVPVVLGKDIQGETQIMDLVKTPHLLIAGATGAGKSVCVNSIILSILFKRSPEEVKMILVDPKIVELKLYNDIPHLLTPVITEPKKAMQALQYCLCEMERRYALLDGFGVRDISSYNKRIDEKHYCTEKLPYLIVIIDEFADLMATAGKNLEGILARLAAMSRAVGIHLVLATQRPSIDVITGLIKANIPSRIAFMVASKTDSRIILDKMGAEQLLGKGDMLYVSATAPFPVRIQGTFVSDQEVEDVVAEVKCWGEPEYIDEEIFVDDEDDDGDEGVSLFNPDVEDPLYEKALDIVVQAGKASASYIQRRLKIGYNRAARLVEEMEERGIVGPANGSKPREVIHIP